MNKQSGFNAEQIDKDKYPESKNHLKIESKITSQHNKTKQKPFDYQINELYQEKITYLSMSSTLLIDLCLVVSIQTNHMCHITSTQLRDYFFT